MRNEEEEIQTHGCHDEWTDEELAQICQSSECSNLEEPSQAEQKQSSDSEMTLNDSESNLQQTVDVLLNKNERWRSYVAHLEWHCAVLRRALGKYEGGGAALKEAQAELSGDNGPYCVSCELEVAMKEVDESKAKLVHRKETYKRRVLPAWMTTSENKDGIKKKPKLNL